MKAVSYYNEHGDFIISGTFTEEDIARFDKEYPNRVDGVYSYGVHCVVDGKVVEKPKCPGNGYVWRHGAWVKDVDAAWASVRAERNRRLQETDWTQLPDVPLTTKNAWAVYRQALRDITKQTDPFNVQWPEPPVRPD